MDAEEIYNRIIKSTPLIDNSNIFKQHLTGERYIKITSNVPFEQLVWKYCEPDKKLANEVMKIAEYKLNNLRRE